MQDITAAFYDQWRIVVSWVNGTLNILTNEQLCLPIAPGKNHGIWILGHLIESEDELGVYLGKSDWLFPQYETLFGQGSTLLPTHHYPTPDVLRRQWKEVCARNDQILTHFTNAEWHEPHTRIGNGNPLDDFFKTKGRCIAIWNIHQAYHAAQLALISSFSTVR
ncbi:MAG TPA: DinB family protein [Chitinophagales bacterium]|nr:DinB family protein [Chitinophagales bacterium]HRK25888.1 DinB family protein [Chitinophagales bacterium]